MICVHIQYITHNIEKKIKHFFVCLILEINPSKKLLHWAITLLSYYPYVIDDQSKIFLYNPRFSEKARRETYFLSPFLIIKSLSQRNDSAETGQICLMSRAQAKQRNNSEKENIKLWRNQYSGPLHVRFNFLIKSSA